jgi:bacteriorhodopsin
VIVILAHLAKMIDLSLVRYGYFAMSQLPIAIQSAALLLGTTAHLQRTDRIGRYHAWRLT